MKTMRKGRFHILLSFAAFLFPFLAASQTEKDSLVRALHGPMHDTVRVKAYFRLFELLAAPDIQKANLYLDSAAMLCKQLKNEAYTAELNFKYGVLYKLKGELDKALEFLFPALQYYEKSSNKERHADVLIRIARNYDSRGNDEKSIEYYQQALDVSKSAGY